MIFSENHCALFRILRWLLDKGVPEARRVMSPRDQLEGFAT
jgi:hypothetical protein